MKNIGMLLLLLCSVYANNLYAQVLTDWEFYALKGKVKQTVEIRISGDGREEGKTVTNYNNSGFIETVKIYDLKHKADKEQYWGQIVYEKYVENKRKAILFDQNEVKLQRINCSWEAKNATKVATIKYSDLVTESKPHTIVIVFNAKNQKETETLFISGEERFNEPAITVEKIYEYNEKGEAIAYVIIQKVESEGYLDEKNNLSLTNETFDEVGNVTKQQIRENGKLISTIVCNYSYY